jgi:hypothetical protein
MGGLGAASLGLALGSNRTAVLSVLGGVAPILGIMMVAFLVIIISGIFEWLTYIVALFTTSVAAGVPFGLVIWGWSNWKKIIGLIFAGAFAFCIAQLIIFLWYGIDGFIGFSIWGPDVVGFIVFGIIGGAFLGASLGFLEKGDVSIASKQENRNIIIRVRNKIKEWKLPESKEEVFDHDTGKCQYCNSSNIDEGYTYSWQLNV